MTLSIKLGNSGEPAQNSKLNIHSNLEIVESNVPGEGLAVLSENEIQQDIDTIATNAQVSSIKYSFN